MILTNAANMMNESRDRAIARRWAGLTFTFAVPISLAIIGLQIGLHRKSDVLDVLIAISGMLGGAAVCAVLTYQFVFRSRRAMRILRVPRAWR